MTTPTLLVTAAAGKTGAATVQELLSRGHAVRALVRRADARSERLRSAGAEILVGSLEDMADLQRSLCGIKRAYFCTPLAPGTLRRASLFAAAAEEAKLEVVVAMSQWVSDPLHPSSHAREKWLSEHVLGNMRGVGLVIVNPGWFAASYMAALEAITQFGVLAFPFGNGLNAPPSNEDTARVIAGALLDPDRHVGKRYRPTGPKLLTPDDLAATFGKVLGRRVTYHDVPFPLFLKVAKSMRYPDFLIVQLHAFLQEYQRNSFGLGAPTDVVLDVGGAPPEDFEQIVRRYVTPASSKRTLGSLLRAVAHIAKAALTRAPDLDALTERLQLPRVEHAILAVDSPRWRSSHVVQP